MAYILKSGGFPVIPGLPAIALEEGAHDQMVDLKRWLALLEVDPAVEEVQIPDERPHYRFRNKKNEEIVIAYFFGYIIPQDRQVTPMMESIMQDYAHHLNQLLSELDESKN